MSVISISRDTQNNVSIVRMIVSDTLATVASTNYIAKQMNNIRALNSGFWSWFTTDMIACSASNGNAFFTFTDATFSSLNEYSGGSSGIVNVGSINQLAWYAANGSTVSGLPTANNSFLTTDSSGVPTWSAKTNLVTPGQIQNQAFSYAVNSGSANAIALTLSPAVTSYVDGQLFSFRAVANNTGATTVAINALAAKSLFVAGTNACVGGEIQGGTSYLIEYNSAANGFFLLNPSQLPPSVLQSGNLPTGVQLQINSFNGGTSASSSTFWRGDGTWASAAVSGAALTANNDTNVTLTLGGTPATALLQASSITAGWTGQLSLARGGTNANLTASNGGIFYSTASAAAILAGTATANQVLLSGSSTTPAWSTATYPATTTINQLLYSSAANTIAGLATANNSILATNGSGVPSLTTSLPSAVQVGVNSLNSGTGASSSTFWRGDGTWAAPGGASNPWSAGAGTGSAIGGDGTATAAGNYSLCYGSSSSTAAGNNAVAIGDNVHATFDYCFVFGRNNARVLNTGSTDNIVMGDGCVINKANHSVAIGYNNTIAASGVVGDSGNVCLGQGNSAGAFNSATQGAAAIGFNCTASGSYSFAQGNAATANNSGSYVWSDGNHSGNQDSAANQWVATAAGGFFLYGGQVSIMTAGKGLTIKSGSNCKVGTAVLSGGTATVSNTSVTANSLILLTVQVAGGTLGNLSIGTVTAGTSFVINSSSAIDTSTVGYMIVEQG